MSLQAYIKTVIDPARCWGYWGQQLGEADGPRRLGGVLPARALAEGEHQTGRMSQLHPPVCTWTSLSCPRLLLTESSTDALVPALSSLRPSTMTLKDWPLLPVTGADRRELRGRACFYHHERADQFDQHCIMYSCRDTCHLRSFCTYVQLSERTTAASP